MALLTRGGVHGSSPVCRADKIHFDRLRGRMLMMRRYLILAIAALILGVGLPREPRVASADAGPHGGGYTATTDACAGCHRAHTAQAPDLLMDTTQALCL